MGPASPSLGLLNSPTQEEAGAYLTADILLLISLDIWTRGWCDCDRRKLGWLLLFKG